jgi:aryl-alcohol dehydrogenase-like predicted oxidoreductase
MTIAKQTPGGTATLIGRTPLIPGTTDPAHLAENIAAGSLRLDPDTIAALDHLGL